MPRWLMLALAVAIYIPVMALVLWALRPATDAATGWAASLIGDWPLIVAMLAGCVLLLYLDVRERQRRSKP